MNANTPTSITITPGTIAKALVVIALGYVLYLIRDLILVLLTAVVIASAVEPAVQWFKRYKVPRLPAVILVYVATIGVLFGAFYTIIPPLLSETVNFLSQVPQYLSSLNVADSLANFRLFGGGIDEIGNAFATRDLVVGLRDYLVNIPGGVFGTVSAVFGGVISFALIVVFSFYLAVQEDGIGRFLRVVVPFARQRYVIDLWQRSQKKIGRWFQGQLLLMLIVGVLVFLGLSILGVKHAFLFAVLAALFELIPLFGPILASIPAIAIGFVDGGVTLALIITGLYIIIQQFENHLIYPLVVNKVVGVPALLVIIALIIGGQLAGFLGVILSVPIAAALQELVADIQRKNKKLEEAEAKRT